MENSNGGWQGRNLKKRVLDLLLIDDFNEVLQTFCSLPARRVINPLFSFLCSTESRIKWHSVTAVGAVVANLAQRDMESARVIMRRLMWNLNDESGGIGWGLPEAMGEIMARHEGLALEYAGILVSYVRKDGNYLEYPPLQRGVLWGLGRLAQTRPDLLQDVPSHLRPFLASKDAEMRALALWILGLLGGRENDSDVETLLADEAEVSIYLNGKPQIHRVSDLAKQALSAEV